MLKTPVEPISAESIGTAGVDASDPGDGLESSMTWGSRKWRRVIGYRTLQAESYHFRKGVGDAGQSERQLGLGSLKEAVITLNSKRNQSRS